MVTEFFVMFIEAAGIYFVFAGPDGVNFVTYPFEFQVLSENSLS